MSRINRPDTLYTELRDLRRRIRRLESSVARPTGATAMAARAPAAVPTLIPERPRDWWRVDSDDWETLARARLSTGDPKLELTLYAADGTGAVRVTIDGEPLRTDIDVRDRTHRTVLALTMPGAERTPGAGGELRIEARGGFSLLATIAAVRRP